MQVGRQLTDVSMGGMSFLPVGVGTLRVEERFDGLGLARRLASMLNNKS